MLTHPVSLSPKAPSLTRGLPNLMASIATVLGGTSSPAPLADLSLDGKRPIVLLVLDGMGEAQLRRHLPAGLLARQRLCTLESVFPSTTASAVGTLMSGLPPISHGLTGWHVWAEEVGELLSILPLTRRHGAPASLQERQAWAQAILAAPNLPTELSLAKRLPVPVTHISPAAIIYSPFNREMARGATCLPYRHINECFVALDQALKNGPSQQLIYAYWPDFDSLAHEFGPDAPEPGLALQTMEQALEAWLLNLPKDTRRPQILVTADHGFIHTPESRRICLNDYPELAALLARPLSGERRAAYVHLKPGCSDEFTRKAAERLGHALHILPSQQLLSDHWFGTGPQHPRLASRVGDLTLLLKDNWTLMDLIPGETPYHLPGMHGGITPAEREVPLCLLE